MSSFKQDIIEMLTIAFNKSITSTINDNYSDDNPQEIYDLAHSMLTKLEGSKNASKKLSLILNRYPEININEI